MKNRYINTKFWEDGFIETLDPSEKLIFLYLLTNPSTNIAGIYEISIKRISFDTGFDSETILKVFKRFANQEKVFYENNHIIITNFLKHQQLNPNIIKGVSDIILSLPEKLKASKPFKTFLKTLLTIEKPSKDLETITKPFEILYYIIFNSDLDLDLIKTTTTKSTVQTKSTFNENPEKEKEIVLPAEDKKELVGKVENSRPLELSSILPDSVRDGQEGLTSSCFFLKKVLEEIKTARNKTAKEIRGILNDKLFSDVTKEKYITNIMQSEKNIKNYKGFLSQFNKLENIAVGG